jgi:hypothetical protein
MMLFQMFHCPPSILQLQVPHPLPISQSTSLFYSVPRACVSQAPMKLLVSAANFQTYDCVEVRVATLRCVIDKRTIIRCQQNCTQEWRKIMYHRKRRHNVSGRVRNISMNRLVISSETETWPLSQWRSRDSPACEAHRLCKLLLRHHRLNSRAMKRQQT